MLPERAVSPAAKAAAMAMAVAMGAVASAGWVVGKGMVGCVEGAVCTVEWGGRGAVAV